MSISEKNKKVLKIIKELRGSGMNVSDKFCEYIIDGYETEVKVRRYQEYMENKRNSTNTLDTWRTEEEENIEALE